MKVSKTKKPRTKKKKPDFDDDVDAMLAEAGIDPSSIGGSFETAPDTGLTQMMSAEGPTPSLPPGQKPRERRVLTSASGPRRKEPAAAPAVPPVPVNRAPQGAPRQPSPRMPAPAPPAAPAAPVVAKKPPPKNVPASPTLLPTPAANDDDDGGYSDESFEKDPEYEEDFEDFEDDDGGDGESSAGLSSMRSADPSVKPTKEPKAKDPKALLGGHKLHISLQPAEQEPVKQEVRQESWMNVGPPPKDDEDRTNRPPLSAMNLRMSQPYTGNRFEQEPMSEYQMLERRMGTYAVNTTKETQTGQDSTATVDVQTDEASETVDAMAQVGGDEADLLSGGGVVLTGSGPARLRRDFDPDRLSVFLRARREVVLSLLAERDLAKEVAKDRDIDIKTEEKRITSGSHWLKPPLGEAASGSPWGGARTIEDAVFSRHQQSLLFVAYGPAYGWIGGPGGKEIEPKPSTEGGKGLLCIWETGHGSNPDRPVHVLICESQPRRCCFSGHRLSQTVFAATEDRSLVVWDLREPASVHATLQVGNGKAVLRRPTYSTDGLLEATHSGSIVSIESITSPVANDEISFQLAMLDDNGGLSVWNVVELSRGDYAGSLKDLCLGVGGKVMLMKSAFINVSDAPLRTCTLQFRPGDLNHAVVGTGLGHVQHVVRHGGMPHPRQYEGYYGDVCDVDSIQYSPFLPHYFLTASNDGTVALYHQGYSRPLHAWSGFNQRTEEINGADQLIDDGQVLSVLWSPSQPQVFFAFTVKGVVFVWDLLKNPDEPFHTERMGAGAAMSSSVEENTSLLKVVFSARGVSNPLMATAFANGTISVRTLSGGYSNSTLNDIRKMHAFLEGVDVEDLPEEMFASPQSTEQKDEGDAFLEEDDTNFGFGQGNMFDDFGGGGIAPAREARKGRRAMGFS